MAKIEPGHFVFISIPMGDAKFVTKKGREGKGRGGQAPILSKIGVVPLLGGHTFSEKLLKSLRFNTSTL